MRLVRRLKLKVNRECKDYLEFASEQCRLLYNFTLAEQLEYYKQTGKKLNMYEQKKKLPLLKQKYPNYAKVYNKCLQAIYFRVEDAYKRFFREKKGFPKFKRRGEFVSQEYPGENIKKVNDYSFILPTGASAEKNFIVKTYEQIPSEYKTVTIIKSSDGFYACFIIEVEEKPIQDNGKVLALDLGVKTLAVGITNEGEKVKVRKYSHKTRHLDKIRSKRDKCRRQSIRRKKWDKVFHREMDRYLNRVTDYLHKQSHELVNRDESTIVVGQLNLDQMKLKQAWFNRVLYNEWRVNKFEGMLEYKCKLEGKKLVRIDEQNTTKMCSRCGNLKQDLTLKDRTYICSNCGLIMDRDENSAVNILNKYEGMADAETGKVLKVPGLELAGASNLNRLGVTTFDYI